MVSFPAVGRMGNFLFECATALAYSLKHKLDFTVPFNTTNDLWSPIYFKHLQNRNFNSSIEKIELWENGHHWQELPFEENWRDKNIFIMGYRQSYKYFDDFRDELLYLFDLPYEKKENYVSVHIRRTDYLHLLDKHPQIGKDWYEKAMSKFGTNFRFKIFSDDISWCVKEFGNRSDCEFSSGVNEVQDLIDASCCEHNISSSSTYSWWISYLNRNPNKIVYIPKLWFVENYPLSTEDIVPQWMTKL